VFHAILDGNTASGVAVHRINESFDAGAILQRQGVALNEGWSVLFATTKLMMTGMELLLSSKHLLLNCSSGMPQLDSGTYKSWPTPKKVRALYYRGKCLMRLRDIKEYRLKESV
jgi:methionyl-tRNA formyltransferase